MISVMTDLKQIDFWSLKYAGLCGPEVISIIHIPFLYFLVFVSTWQDDIMKQKKHQVYLVDIISFRVQNLYIGPFRPYL